jgi:uncharacterized membrane protein
MTENPDRINELIERLESLSKQQELFSKEIYALRNELFQLKFSSVKQESIQSKEKEAPKLFEESGFKVIPEDRSAAINTLPTQIPKPVMPQFNLPAAAKKPATKSSLEKFIGENLINKIGIAITVIGVAIGAKYSIDHELISPLTRIILGYIMGLGLLLFGIKLKAKYENYSAVLVSGAMAIMYFITYAAYSFYNLFPQTMAFALMVVFTIFTVIAAINYNKQVIAHIGLVGAYGVPFLLSDGSGKVAVLFSYMAIINTGILAIAVRKYWKLLYYSSFILTWIIFSSWYDMQYNAAKHFALAFTFLIIFFTLFYLIFLAYKVIKKEKFQLPDIFLLLVNSFIFYAIGYSLLQGQPNVSELLGLFTLCNAVVHFIVSLVIYKQKLADRNLFFMISGLALVFITIAIPVQLDGNWVTLLWAGEALLLFWIGRAKNVAVYEILSYPLMLLAFISLLQDWSTVYDRFVPGVPGTSVTPLGNINFLSSLLFIASFGCIQLLNRNQKYSSALKPGNVFKSTMSFIVPAILLFTIYNAFRLEIDSYWTQLYKSSEIVINQQGQDYKEHIGNEDLFSYKTIWEINYTLFFLLLLSVVNINKLKDRQLAFINLGLNIAGIALFLLVGLYTLSSLRDSYLTKHLPAYFKTSSFNVGIRYISFSLVAGLLYTSYQYIRQDFLKFNFEMLFDLLLHTTILWIASSELITWMDIGRSAQSYKLGLSILWGIYSLLLIALGIWKKRTHLRIGAIALFGVTLVKLFLYDIADLNTIAKTIVFVSLGVLLLIISFLYNKYKHIISNEVQN